MDDWLRGIIATSLLLVLAYVIYAIATSSPVTATVGAMTITVISVIALVALTYSIENDDFSAGALVPLLVAAIFAIAFFTEVPIGETAFAVILAQFFGLTLITESD